MHGRPIQAGLVFVSPFCIFNAHHLLSTSNGEFISFVFWLRLRSNTPHHQYLSSVASGNRLHTTANTSPTKRKQHENLA